MTSLGSGFGVLVPLPCDGDDFQGAILVRLSTEILNLIFNLRRFDTSNIEHRLPQQVVFTYSITEMHGSVHSRADLLKLAQLRQTTLGPGPLCRVREHLTIVTLSEAQKASVWLTADALSCAGGDDAAFVHEWVIVISWTRRVTEGVTSGEWMCERIEVLSLAGGFIGVL